MENIKFSSCGALERNILNTNVSTKKDKYETKNFKFNRTNICNYFL